MDYIKKVICIEDVRTRTQGLMPYYEFGKEYAPHGSGCQSVSSLGLTTATGDNGNWGQFVANPCFLGDNKTYNTMLHNYYTLLNMVRDGIKLRRVKTKEGEIIFTEDLGAFSYGNCPSGGTGFIGGDEPDYLYAYAAYDINDFHTTDIESLRDETKRIYRTDLTVNDDFIVLIKDFDLFKGCARYLDGTAHNQVSNVPLNGDDHHRWAQYCQIVDACIGKLNIPARIYNKHLKVPKSMAMADINSYIAWLKENKNPSGDCCSWRLWEDRGGDEMLEFLNAHKDDYTNTLNKLNGLQYRVPYMEMPLLLSQSFTDVGVFTNVDGVDYEENLTDKQRPHGIGSPTGLTIDEIRMGHARKTHPTTGDTAIEVESLIKTLRSKKKYMDDRDNTLPGLFRKFAGNPYGKYITVTKNGGTWTTAATTSNFTNGDGLPSSSVKNTSFYRSITTVAAGIRIAEVEEIESGEIDPAGTTYIFKVKYDNSPSSPMDIPYAPGNIANAYYDREKRRYRGDFILDIDRFTEDGATKVRFEYVIGGFFRVTSTGEFAAYIGGGDIYQEEYVIDTHHVDYVALDGVDDVPVYSEYIDFEADAKEFYSPRYNLYRTGNTANITELSTGEYWNENYSYDAYLTKEDYLINFSSPPKVDVNVTIDRGGVSAFERHYKLAECNTMQDLENYANGWFFEQ